ncbi:hypothetical protein KC887_04350 [Candidatus Kaiserbacteria bacterium]|nr:hypothetical protein [Candidatus Kaiserbacteria bacterium]
MSDVFVLEQRIPYEGACVFGVFSSVKSAVELALAQTDRDYNWYTVTKWSVDGGPVDVASIMEDGVEWDDDFSPIVDSE